MHRGPGGDRGQGGGARWDVGLGCHRDDEEVVALGLPVFSYGTIPLGPDRATPRGPEAFRSARVGVFEVTSGDFVLADRDGAVFAPTDRAAELIEVGRSIVRVEREQAERVRAGTTLREQMAFSDYLAERAREPSHTFREHLRRMGAEVEEEGLPDAAPGGKFVLSGINTSRTISASDRSGENADGSRSPGPI